MICLPVRKTKTNVLTQDVRKQKKGGIREEKAQSNQIRLLSTHPVRVLLVGKVKEGEEIVVAQRDVWVGFCKQVRREKKKDRRCWTKRKTRRDDDRGGVHSSFPRQA